jgi:hypothetical protein
VNVTVVPLKGVLVFGGGVVSTPCDELLNAV